MNGRALGKNEKRETPITRVIIVCSSALAGSTAIIPMLKEFPLLRPIPGLYLLVFLPISLMGGLYLVFGRGFKQIPITLPLLLTTLAGISWTEIQDIPRAFLLVFSFFVTIAFGAALRTEYAWLLAARTFVIFATLASIILFLDYRRVRPPRLGLVYNDQGVRIIEPNIPGTLCAFAALVALILLIQYKAEVASLIVRVSLVICFLVLISTLLLTKSRGAALAFIGALFVLVVFGRFRKTIWFYLSCGLGLFGMPFLALAIPPSIYERFTSPDISSYGERRVIWEQAVDTMASHPLQLILGAGTGSGATSLGQHAPFLGAFLNVVDYSGYTGGTLRINAHSSYIEWWLSFGFLGLVIGVVLIVLLLARAIAIDKNQMLASGTSLVTFFLLISITLIAYRIPGVSVACGGFTIGYLYFRRHGEAGLPSRIARKITPLMVSPFHAHRLWIHHYQ